MIDTGILTCGHLPTPQGNGLGTGYARTAADPEVTLCYPCADASERAAMADPDTMVMVAYVSGDGFKITTWSGGELARVTGSTVSRTGFHGSKVWAVSAVTPDGARWYGRNGGAGMVITLRRAKGVTPAPRAVRADWTYRGITITRTASSAMWVANLPGYAGYLKADTKDGMRALIRHHS